MQDTNDAKELHTRNTRLGLILASVALLMFIVMLVWAGQYMKLPT